jgi:hypothetical protein
MKDDPASVDVEWHCKSCGMYRPAAFKLDEYVHLVLTVYSNLVIVIRRADCKKADFIEYPVVIWYSFLEAAAIAIGNQGKRASISNSNFFRMIKARSF